MKRCSLSRGWAAVALAAAVTAGLARAADPGPEPRVAVGQMHLGRRRAADSPGGRQGLAARGQKDMVSSRDELLALPGMKAVLETEPRGVEAEPARQHAAAIAVAGAGIRDRAPRQPGLRPRFHAARRASGADQRQGKRAGPRLGAAAGFRLAADAARTRRPRRRWKFTAAGPTASASRRSRTPAKGRPRRSSLLVLSGQAELQTDTHTYELVGASGAVADGMGQRGRGGQAGRNGSRRCRRGPTPTWLVPAEGKAIEERGQRLSGAAEKGRFAGGGAAGAARRGQPRKGQAAGGAVAAVRGPGAERPGRPAARGRGPGRSALRRRARRGGPRLADVDRRPTPAAIRNSSVCCRTISATANARPRRCWTCCTVRSTRRSRRRMRR